MQKQKSRYGLFNNRGAKDLIQHLGVSLIEYMVAVTLGVTIILFLFEVYTSMKASHRFADQMQNLTAQAQTLIALIAREVYVAGRMGCEQITENHLLYDNTNRRFQMTDPMIVDKQHLRLTHTQSDYALLLNDVRLQSYIEITSAMQFHEGDDILLSDCINSELARVYAVWRINNHMQRVYLANPLHFEFKKNTMVAKRVVIDIFFQNHKKRGMVYMSVNGYRTPVADHIENLLFTRTGMNAIAFQFDVVIGAMQKKWYGYATIR